MRLVDIIHEETGAEYAEIMLLRHSTSIVKKLEAAGGSLDEYTNTQPTGSRYDYLADGRSPISVIVEIVRDHVRRVYRVLGVEVEATVFSLVSNENKQFYRSRGYKDRPARRFLLEQLSSAADQAMITGWEGRQRSPTSRSDGKTFWDIEVNLPRRDRARPARPTPSR